MFEKWKLNKRIKELEKSVTENDAQAMYDLAMIYLDGSVIRKNENQAYALMQKAAYLGHLPSKTYLIANKISESFVIGTKAVDEILKIYQKYPK